MVSNSDFRHIHPEPSCGAGLRQETFYSSADTLLLCLPMSHLLLDRTLRHQPPLQSWSQRGRLYPRWTALFFCTLALSKAVAGDQDWANVGGDKGHQRYSNLDQINRNNVATLQVAWTFHTSDAGVGTTIECTPIVIGGVMY